MELKTNRVVRAKYRGNLDNSRALATQRIGRNECNTITKHQIREKLDATNHNATNGNGTNNNAANNNAMYQTLDPRTSELSRISESWSNTSENSQDLAFRLQGGPPF